ncbi:MAG: glycosyltransferase family 2 protein [Bacteroidales bacterium]|nr:glycosyltransferase family 2 protein [Bacteroidales bacterium]
MENNFKISIVIPCYNEEDNIIPLTEILLKTLKKYNDYEIIFVDDGSYDKTLKKIKEIRNKNKKIKIISFSRNFGHQNAIKAGFDYSTGDCVISLDSDLQHPPGLIDEMIEKWQEGYQVVYAVRNNFKSLGFFKRTTSKLFYKIINSISDVKMTYNAADFRLIDREVVNAIKQFKENYLYIRGIVSWVGFKQTTIKYKQEKRFSGESKYSLKKMIKFALSGITSFSIKPLKLSLILGFIISFFSFLYGLYALYIAFFTDRAITGWTSVIVSVLFIGGIQLFMIGVLGEYLGKLFMENKRRPNYIIKDKEF